MFTIPLVLLSAVLVSGTTTLLLVPLTRRIALQKGWVDKPDGARKLHSLPIPNVGGVAIAAGFGVGLMAFMLVGEWLPFEMPVLPLAVFVGGLLMISAGFYDDVRGLSFKKKFVIQIIVAYMLLHAGYRFELAELPFVGADPFQHALYSIPLTMIWIVGVINAVNLLDGLDGLAAGISIIALAFLALIFGMQGDLALAAMGLLLVGAIAGFLVYNFNPASIFMGDSGSLFLGYMVAVYALEGRTHADPVLAIVVPVVVLGLPILDTILCIVRRLSAGRSPFAPDKDHIHHRFMWLWSHRRTVVVCYAVAMWFGVAALLMTLLPPLYGWGVGGVTFLVALLGVRTLGYLEDVKLGFARLFRESPLHKQLSFDFDLADAAPTVKNGTDLARKNGAEALLTREVDEVNENQQTTHQTVLS